MRPPRDPLLLQYGITANYLETSVFFDGSQLTSRFSPPFITTASVPSAILTRTSLAVTALMIGTIDGYPSQFRCYGNGDNLERLFLELETHPDR